jgi:hypothetical protein
MTTTTTATAATTTQAKALLDYAREFSSWPA